MEAILVFAIIGGFSAFSLGFLPGYLAQMHRDTIQAQFNDIASAADSASTITLSLSNMTIGCQGSILAMVSGTQNMTVPISGYCQFTATDLSETATLAFSRASNGTLSLEVS